MSDIKGKTPQPELTVRKMLFKKGFRYKLHDKSLLGSPDIVLPISQLYLSMVVFGMDIIVLFLSGLYNTTSVLER
jgi:G:T-mismatch repair DNA endonuclease (very short patch repair protein)